MCKGLELIEMMAETVTEMHLHIKELRERQNDVNLMRSDIQHQLENEEVTPTNAYNLAKAYHLLSKERREVTDEIELLIKYLMDLVILGIIMKIKFVNANIERIDVKKVVKYIVHVN